MPAGDRAASFEAQVKQRDGRPHLSKRKVEDVGEGVVGHDPFSPQVIHLCADCVAHPERPPGHAAYVQHVPCSHLHHRHAAPFRTASQHAACQGTAWYACTAKLHM